MPSLCKKRGVQSEGTPSISLSRKWVAELRVAALALKTLTIYYMDRHAITCPRYNTIFSLQWYLEGKYETTSAFFSDNR